MGLLHSSKIKTYFQIFYLTSTNWRCGRKIYIIPSPNNLSKVKAGPYTIFYFKNLLPLSNNKIKRLLLIPREGGRWDHFLIL